MTRKLTKYRVSFSVAGKNQVMEVESYGVLDACREVRVMYPTAQVLEVVRI